MMNKFLTILLLLSAFIITGCTNSPAKTLVKFEDIVAEKDVEELFKLVSIEEGVYWSEKEAEDVIDYFSENTSAYEEQLSLLHGQKDALKEKKNPVNETGLFYFNDEKKLAVRTYEVSLDKGSFVKFKELLVSIREDEAIRKEDGSDENIVVGLFGPGQYNLKGHADYGYVTLDDTTDVALFDDKDFNMEIELDLKGEADTFFSSQPNTNLYINDSKINQDIGEKDGVSIQPLVDGLILRAENEFSWGKLVSEELEYTKDMIGQENYNNSDFSVVNGVDLTPYIFTDEEGKKEIAQIITGFNEKLLKGLAENEPSYLDDAVATDEAKAGYDSDFEILTQVEKGELTVSSFPYGTGAWFVGHYKGGLLESIIDFSHAENPIDEETSEDLLVLKVMLKTNFFYIPEGSDVSSLTKDTINYIEPIIHLKKEDDQWI
ncbi:hypothetical protein J4G37_34750, partial [Microvirga sp. 3-52]|nr:hypothetical protein [Microvirga sp. 3-52]